MVLNRRGRETAILNELDLRLLNDTNANVCDADEVTSKATSRAATKDFHNSSVDMISCYSVPSFKI